MTMETAGGGVDSGGEYAQSVTATQHPIIQSAERGEKWRWCYVDETYLD